MKNYLIYLIYNLKNIFYDVISVKIKGEIYIYEGNQDKYKYINGLVIRLSPILPLILSYLYLEKTAIYMDNISIQDTFKCLALIIIVSTIIFSILYILIYSLRKKILLRLILSKEINCPNRYQIAKYILDNFSVFHPLSPRRYICKGSYVFELKNKVLLNTLKILHFILYFIVLIICIVSISKVNSSLDKTVIENIYIICTISQICYIIISNSISVLYLIFYRKIRFQIQSKQ